MDPLPHLRLPVYPVAKLKSTVLVVALVQAGLCGLSSFALLKLHQPSPLQSRPVRFFFHFSRALWGLGFWCSSDWVKWDQMAWKRTLACFAGNAPTRSPSAKGFRCSRGIIIVTHFVG